MYVDILLSQFSCLHHQTILPLSTQFKNKTINLGLNNKRTWITNKISQFENCFILFEYVWQKIYTIQ